MKKLTILFAVALLLVAGSAQASWYLDFEWALGDDGAQVSSGVPGLQFSTSGAYNWVYADVTTGNYNASSDNGNVYGGGNYFMSGNVNVWLGPDADWGRIDFTGEDGSWFETGYCSHSTFYLEAYDANGSLIDQAVGAANTQQMGGTEMGYVSVSSANNDIAYVIMHDTGNFWIADNMSGDASGVAPPIPEPATLILLGSGLLGMGILRRKNR
ncbi:MAG: PEP-CTERM sorting domain-containing protein [candidate division Zixibacteria bacterium]|nr:PEP-CTERM sorting domain-containing protein [candidate division Zixibacteria bacterium]